MWQRAKLLDDARTSSGAIALPRGSLLWVKAGAPINRRRTSVQTRARWVQPGYDTNIRAPKSWLTKPGRMELISVPQNKVELIALFSNDIGPADWLEWDTLERNADSGGQQSLF